MPERQRRATTLAPEQQLPDFIAKFAESDQKLIRAVRAAVRRRLPTANELVWDNYNFFVIGYSPTERPSDSIISIAARANGVGLCFVQGASLPDPGKLLSGSGKQTRFLRLKSAADLNQPAVEAARRSDSSGQPSSATNGARQVGHPVYFKEAAASETAGAIERFIRQPKATASAA
jgi:hypothetical protein